MISVLARGKVAANITKDATPIIVSQHSLCLAFHQHKVSHKEVVLFDNFSEPTQTEVLLFNTRTSSLVRSELSGECYRLQVQSETELCDELTLGPRLRQRGEQRGDTRDSGASCWLLAASISPLLAAGSLIEELCLVQQIG